MKKIMFIIALCLLPNFAFAAKSPTPRITEVAGIGTSEARIHFQLNPISANQSIKVKYSLKTSTFNDVKYKIPKNARRNGIVNAATSAAGSAIDFHGLPLNVGKFIYNVKVKVMVPGKSWSKWSNGFSF